MVKDDDHADDRNSSNTDAFADRLKELLRTVSRSEDSAHDCLESPDYEKLIQCLGDGGQSNAKSHRSYILAQLILVKLYEAIHNEAAIAKVAQRTKKIICGHNDWSAHPAIFAAQVSGILQTGSEIGALVLSDEGIMNKISQLIVEGDTSSQIALLKLLSLAANHKKCRSLIGQHANQQFAYLLNDKNPTLQAAAAVLVTKLMHGQSSQAVVKQDKESYDSAKQEADAQFASLFRRLSLNSKDNELLQMAFEGLAHCSRNPGVKEEIAKDEIFCKAMLQKLQTAGKEGIAAMVFSILTTIDNVMSYKRKFSEQDRMVNKIRSMAEGQKSNGNNPLNDDSSVQRRNQQFLQMGIVSTLVSMQAPDSENIRARIASILLNLVTYNKNRRLVVQQGGAKILLSLASRNLDVNSHSKSALDIAPLPASAKPNFIAIQALAEIIISIDPRLLFPSSSTTILSTVRPLLAPLSQSEDDLLKFECLLALTNLSSLPPNFVQPLDSLRSRILGITSPVSSNDPKAPTLSVFEDLLFSPTLLLRRATMELVCNLISHPTTMQLYAFPIQPATPAYASDDTAMSMAKNRIKIILALTDDVDFKTRRAAAGALAMMLTNIRILFEDEEDASLRKSPAWSFLADTIANMSSPDGTDCMIRLLDDDGKDDGKEDLSSPDAKQEMQLRAIECLRHLVILSKTAREKLLAKDIINAIKKVVTTPNTSRDTIAVCIEVIKSLS